MTKYIVIVSREQILFSRNFLTINYLGATDRLRRCRPRRVLRVSRPGRMRDSPVGPRVLRHVPRGDDVTGLVPGDGVRASDHVDRPARWRLCR